MQSEKVIQLDWVPIIFGSAAILGVGSSMESYHGLQHTPDMPCRSFAEVFDYGDGSSVATSELLSEQADATPTTAEATAQPVSCFPSASKAL